MTDSEPTVVLFRVWRAAPKTVIALFPYELGTMDPATCQSYEHMGQHGPANPVLVIGATRPATPEEYADLRRELERPPYGYRLTVRQRTPHDDAEVRAAKLRRMREAARHAV